MRLLNLMQGWHRRRTAEGVTLIAPHGPDAAAVQIVEERRPLRRMSDILDDVVGGMAPDLRAVATRTPIETITTSEGEYGAIATVTASLASNRIVRTIAMIVGADAYTLIDGICARPSLEDTTANLVREIATNYFLSLGGERRRMYRYDVPERWLGVRRAHSTIFYHPDHPRHGGTIEVFDTRPAGIGAADLQDRMLFVDSPRIKDADPPNPPQRVISAHGVAGARVAITGMDASGSQVVIHRVTLTDTHHIYIVQAEALATEIADCLPALVRILSSIRPLPRKGLKLQDDSFIHWSD